MDDVLPEPQWRTGHRRTVAAPASRVWEAVETTDVARSPVVRLLAGGRLLPAVLAGRRPRPGGRARTIAEVVPFQVISLDPGRELVIGGVGQPWRLSGGLGGPALDGPALRAFDEPGWLKMAFSVTVEQVGDGTRLSTETRVAATDDDARRRFAAYWTIVRPFSGMIRKSLLARVAAAATAAPGVAV